MSKIFLANRTHLSKELLNRILTVKQIKAELLLSQLGWVGKQGRRWGDITMCYQSPKERLTATAVGLRTTDRL